MRSAAGIEYITRQHGIEVQPSELHSHRTQYQKVVFRVLSGLSDGRVRQEISERLHLRRVERREIPNAGRPVLPQHSGSNAQQVAVVLPFLYRRFRENLIAPSNQAAFFWCVGCRSVACGIDEEFSLSTL